LWTPAYTPGRRSDQLGVLQQHWTVHVSACICISCYVTVNKPVLSYLLSRLLPHPPHPTEEENIRCKGGNMKWKEQEKKKMDKGKGKRGKCELWDKFKLMEKI
jgi:hypothetical protein